MKEASLRRGSARPTPRTPAAHAIFPVVASARVPDPAPGLSLTEHVVLALICERPAHGWPIVRALAEDGEIGQIWTVGRGLVYRTIDQLTERRLVAASGTVSGGAGPARTILRATPAGRRASRRWLGEPVEHVRDLRSELLLK